ncbi:MAG: SurA N-terminal domain-containing protein [Thermodesulfovibrionales bacterium]
MQRTFLHTMVSALLLTLLTFSPAAADFSDRVVAYVDNQAITLSELTAQHAATLRLTPDVTGEDVLNTMINRVILLKEAKKYRIEAPTRDEVISEYINLKLRAFIRVSDQEIEGFYRENTGRFQGREYDDVRGEIETYLSEKALNAKLKDTLRDLRKNADIKIQLTE